MNRSTMIASGIALLLAGALAFTLIRQSDGKKVADAPKDPKPTAGKAGESGSGGPSDGGPRAERIRQREETKNSDLVAKYGESRTNLSKHVTSNVIGLLDDAVQMGEMAANGQFGGPFGSRGGFRMGLGRVANDLNLTEEQQQKGAAIYSEFQKRELANSKQAIGNLRKDPTPLMKLMLASDALARGEITEDEYKTLQNSSGEDLKGILNPLNERNFRGGRPLRDDTFRAELEAILDPAQAEILRKSIEEQGPAAPNPAADEASIASMPSMELEKLDTTIESVKKLTTGFKTVMEGFGGLQELGPMLEQQRQRREGTPAPAEGSEKPE